MASRIAEVIRSSPLTKFVQLARLQQGRLVRVVIVSPWVVTRQPEFSPLIQLMAVVNVPRVRFTVVTRSPDRPSHTAAVELMARVPEAEILYLDSLHAKLYLLEANGLRAAMLGSPNFTPEGNATHRELAVQVRSIKDSDPADALITELFDFTRELMTDPRTRFHKRRAERRP